MLLLFASVSYSNFTCYNSYVAIKSSFEDDIAFGKYTGQVKRKVLDTI